MLVKVTWNDAVSSWPVWNTLPDIVAELADTEVVSVGHLVEGHDLGYLVLAVSKTGKPKVVGSASDGENYGGIVAIPKGMVTHIETLDVDDA